MIFFCLLMLLSVGFSLRPCQITTKQRQTKRELLWYAVGIFRPDKMKIEANLSVVNC